MKLKKMCCFAMSTLMCLSILGNNAYALGDEFVASDISESYIFDGNLGKSVIAENTIGKTNINTSVYGYDLEDNMVEETPNVSSFTIQGSNVNVSGYVNENDLNTAFNLTGAAYKTFDNNIVCNVIDTTGNYDVLFLCLEKGQENNDYILYRNAGNGVKGDYGLKVYLMKKGTRDISIIEDTNVEIINVQNILDNLEETDYSNLNWFTSCFEPIPEVEPANVTKKEYQFIDTEVYYFGSVQVKLGVILTATNDTPTVSNQASFTSKLQHSYYVYSTNPSYNQPARAEGYFRVENINISSTVGQGYYIQQIHWNGAGATTLSASLSLNAYIGYGSIFGGNITLSSSPKSFKKDNWLNLIDRDATDYNRPRRADTKYTNLIISTPSHYADFSATITNATNATDKFKCYQTIWSFDITKKNSWAGYSSYKTNQSVTCTSYFS